MASRPAIPPPLVLGSGADGGPDQGTVVNVQAYRASGVSGTQSFTLRYQAAYILDPTLQGVAGTLTFRLVPRSAPANATADEPSTAMDKLSPGPSLPLALVPLGLAALVRRRFG